MTQSVPGAVATWSVADEIELTKSNPVAIAPGTDLIDPHSLVD